MSTESREELQSKIFAKLESIAVAFSSASRLKLIQVLAQSPRTVEELAEATGQSVANTSQHLQRLAKEGLVTVTKSGVSRIYRVRSARVVNLWESLQDLGHELALELTEAENQLTDPALRTAKNATEVLKEVRSKKAVLLDVRDATEAKSTPLQGALVVPLDELKVAMKQLTKDKPVYVFCRGRYCVRASEAVRKLRAAGFESYRLRESPFKLASIQNEKETAGS